jgi:uncharacterized circularly permuted ATP-grasp superfamily protein
MNAASAAMDSTPVSASPEVAQMLAAYPGQMGAAAFDESRFPDGTPRPAWNRFLESISRFSTRDLTDRRDTTNRLLREHGATYTIYTDQVTANRPWKLDIFPFIIAPDEWRQLERGLKQRSRLLRLLLADIYGERRLLKEGWMPPGLVFANPGFLRAAHGIQPAGGAWLFHHAVDLARGADGRWIVLADRTQAPSGKGYSLENRIVLTSIFADEFRDLGVQRLAGSSRSSATRCATWRRRTRTIPWWCCSRRGR